jgi:guanylate kinase
MAYLGNLFIISAPSGAGKTSLVKALLAKEHTIKLSISHTTRKMRPGEVDGVDYHFVDEQTFLTMLNQENFLESAQVHGARYGTSKSLVETELEAGFDVLLEIDWQGAQQIRKIFPEAKSIFVLPPALEVLESRLNARGQDSVETIQRRVAVAKTEMAQVCAYDYVIINDDFNDALQDLTVIVHAERLNISVQQKRHATLIQSLT